MFVGVFLHGLLEHPAGATLIEGQLRFDGGGGRLQVFQKRVPQELLRVLPEWRDLLHEMPMQELPQLPLKASE
jgi:hypothetical protein